MEQVNIHEAKTHLSSLIEEVAAGKPFIIAKSGKPMAMVVPYHKDRQPARIGFSSQEISIPNDFDRMHADEIAEMFGE